MTKITVTNININFAELHFNDLANDESIDYKDYIINKRQIVEFYQRSNSKLQLNMSNGKQLNFDVSMFSIEGVETNDLLYSYLKGILIA